MNELLKQTDELIAKINRLLDKSDKQAATLLMREGQIRELQQTVKEKSERIRQLEEDRSSQKVMDKVHFQDDDAKEVKKRINEYLREIDKCIARLSAGG